MSCTEGLLPQRPRAPDLEYVVCSDAHAGRCERLVDTRDHTLVRGGTWLAGATNGGTLQ
jgi:hypothetical protein